MFNNVIVGSCEHRAGRDGIALARECPVAGRENDAGCSGWAGRRRDVAEVIRRARARHSSFPS